MILLHYDLHYFAVSIMVYYLSIISIIDIITQLFAFFLFQNIIAIFLEDYHYNDFVTVSFMAIIPIITLLFALYFCLTVITIINYCNKKLLREKNCYNTYK